MKRVFPVFFLLAFGFLLPGDSPAEAACGGTCKAICTNGTETQSGTCSVANGDPATSAGLYCCTATSTGGSATTASGSTTITFINPLNYDTVQEVLGVFLTYTQGVIVTIALVFLVLGGIMYIFSAGDEKRANSAKTMITAAMIGLAIGIAAPSFLKEIATILDWGNGTNNIPAEVNAAPSLMTIASNVLNFLLAMTGILAILMIVVGGLMYFAASGDEKRADTAKNIVKFAVVGTAVALVSLIIVRTIAGFFATS
ncbi:MAG: hypothetical protein HGA31_04600 [Candidatus Moranbacteria bacterium]|nr:hypothetical protein [Candidatus Moranbacteria bacterium]